MRALFVTLAATAVASIGMAATPGAPAQDISGPWEIDTSSHVLKTFEGNAPPLTTQGQMLYEQNKANPDNDPNLSCLPPGIPRALTQQGYPFNIVVGETMVGMMIQWNHLPRIIYMNRDHFENIGPEYLGQSIGHWEGSTLVVDTNGYNDKTWLDDSGLPHTDELHTVERIRLKNANTLEDKIMFEDPKVFSKPWTALITFAKRTGVIIKEDYCLGRLGKGVTISR